MASLSDLIHKGGFTQRQSKVLTEISGSGPLSVSGRKVASVGFYGPWTIPAATDLAVVNFATATIVKGAAALGWGTPGDDLDVTIVPSGDIAGRIAFPEHDAVYDVQVSFSAMASAADAGKFVELAVSSLSSLDQVRTLGRCKGAGDLQIHSQLVASVWPAPGLEALNVSLDTSNMTATMDLNSVVVMIYQR